MKPSFHDFLVENYIDDDCTFETVCGSPLEIELVHKVDGIIGRASGRLAALLIKLLKHEYDCENNTN